MQFAGRWHITEMDMWDQDYLNMETQAYVEIEKAGIGDFQFGLVTGELEGEVARAGGVERLEFTWEGQDELEPVSGSGWIKLIDRTTAEGYIKFHEGDSSGFVLKRA